MLYARIDLHQRYPVVPHTGGALVDERRLPNDAEVIQTYFVRWVSPCRGLWRR